MVSKEVISLKSLVVKKLKDLKIENIEVFDVSNQSSLADYMVIGSGRSSKHIESSLENLALELKKLGMSNIRPEGISSSGWVLLDVKDVIIHLFLPDVRIRYNMEQIFEKKGV